MPNTTSSQGCEPKGRKKRARADDDARPPAGSGAGNASRDNGPVPTRVFLNVKLLIAEGVFVLGAVMMLLGIMNMDPGLAIPVSNLVSSTNLLLELGIIMMMFAGVFLLKSLLGPIRDLRWGRPMAIVGMVLLVASPFLFTAISAVWLFILSVMIGFLGLEAYTIASFVFVMLKTFAILCAFAGILLCAIAKRRSAYITGILDEPDRAGSDAGATPVNESEAKEAVA